MNPRDHEMINSLGEQGRGGHTKVSSFLFWFSSNLFGFMDLLLNQLLTSVLTCQFRKPEMRSETSGRCQGWCHSSVSPLCMTDAWSERPPPSWPTHPALCTRVSIFCLLVGGIGVLGQGAPVPEAAINHEVNTNFYQYFFFTHCTW